MKRCIDHDLRLWAEKVDRKPILLRGARQVGKTYTVRTLGAQFESYVEVNFELNKHVQKIFDQDLDPVRIVRELAAEFDKQIVPGKTLLFFDEVQHAPEAITALRYFYEHMPELHVIAAGSLIDFAIKAVGVPVGRVISLYMYPMTFMEFLHALGKTHLMRAILEHTSLEPLPEVLHAKALELFAQYSAIGGMPEVVKLWKTHQDAAECRFVHATILEAYWDDFGFYAKRFQEKYVRLLFAEVPRLLGQRFKYSAIEGAYRKRDLAPSLELLETAGLIHTVQATAAQKTPLGAEVDGRSFKVIFIDVALAQASLGQRVQDWLKDPWSAFSNKGAVIEALVGQELIGYSYPYVRAQLYYWQRQARGSQAEVDYVVQDQTIVPIEVKSGNSSSLTSMRSFLTTHPHAPYGIRFSPRNYGIKEDVHSVPLYAISCAFEETKARVAPLLSSDF